MKIRERREAGKHRWRSEAYRPTPAAPDRGVAYSMKVGTQNLRRSQLPYSDGTYEVRKIKRYGDSSSSTLPIESISSLEEINSDDIPILKITPENRQEIEDIIDESLNDLPNVPVTPYNPPPDMPDEPLGPLASPGEPEPPNLPENVLTVVPTNFLSSTGSTGNTGPRLGVHKNEGGKYVPNTPMNQLTLSEQKQMQTLLTKKNLAQRNTRTDIDYNTSGAYLNKPRAEPEYFDYDWDDQGNFVQSTLFPEDEIKNKKVVGITNLGKGGRRENVKIKPRSSQEMSTPIAEGALSPNEMLDWNTLVRKAEFYISDTGEYNFNSDNPDFDKTSKPLKGLPRPGTVQETILEMFEGEKFGKTREVVLDQFITDQDIKQKDSQLLNSIIQGLGYLAIVLVPGAGVFISAAAATALSAGLTLFQFVLGASLTYEHEGIKGITKLLMTTVISFGIGAATGMVMNGAKRLFGVVFDKAKESILKIMKIIQDRTKLLWAKIKLTRAGRYKGLEGEKGLGGRTGSWADTDSTYDLEDVFNDGIRPNTMLP